jgi:hypothetical protein
MCLLLCLNYEVLIFRELTESKGETITHVNGDVSINCSKRLQIE